MAQSQATILSGINAGFKKYFGRNATRGELSYYATPGRYSKLQSNLLADQKNLLPQYRQTPAQAAPGIPTYDEFLKGAGSPYASLFSDQTINDQYDPYFNQQQGGLDYQKGNAQQDLTQAQGQTTQNYGQNFNDRGLYGSGIYQQELGKALDGLSQNFNRSFGSSPYSSYSEQKANIEQSRIVDKERAKLQGQNTAFDAYAGQYAPALLNSY